VTQNHAAGMGHNAAATQLTSVWNMVLQESCKNKKLGHADIASLWGWLALGGEAPQPHCPDASDSKI